MEQTYWLSPRDKPGLLAAIMKLLAGNAHILLQGDLNSCDFSAVPKADGNRILPFDTLNEKQDGQHIALRLEPETIQPILAQVLPHGRIVHDIGFIQIEKNGRIEFMSGDNFHNECVSVGPAVSEHLLRDLTSRGILRTFQTNAEAKKRFKQKAQPGR